MQAIGVDLRDLWVDGSRVTPRYVLMLAEHLPPESATHASLQGGSQHRSWTPTTHMLAGLVNLTYAANRQRAGKRTSDPLVKPPGPKRDTRARTVTVAEIVARQKAQQHN